MAAFVNCPSVIYVEAVNAPVFEGLVENVFQIEPDNDPVGRGDYLGDIGGRLAKALQNMSIPNDQRIELAAGLRAVGRVVTLSNRIEFQLFDADFESVSSRRLDCVVANELLVSQQQPVGNQFQRSFGIGDGPVANGSFHVRFLLHQHVKDVELEFQAAERTRLTREAQVYSIRHNERVDATRIAFADHQLIAGTLADFQLMPARVALLF